MEMKQNYKITNVFFMENKRLYFEQLLINFFINRERELSFQSVQILNLNKNDSK